MDKHRNYINTQKTAEENNLRKLNYKNKVDINVLLNRVRSDKKKKN